MNPPGVEFLLLFFYCWGRKICEFAPWKTWKQGEIPCRNFEVWDESLNTRRNEPNKMAEAIGGQQRIHKSAQLLVFFEVRLSSFHRHSEGGNNIKEQNKQTVSQISNCHFYYCLFMGVRKEGSVDRSVQLSVYQVRRHVRGPKVSVFGSPGKLKLKSV